MNAMFLLGQEVVAACHLPVPETAQYGSVAFMCRDCGEIWGRFYIIGQKWHCDYAPCKKHGTLASYPGGSFLNGLGALRLLNYRDCFPHEFWLYELRVLASVDELW